MISAIRFLPDIISDPDAVVITPVKDHLITGNKLGHIVLFPDKQVFVEDKKFYGSPFNYKQKQTGFKGSWLMVGNNPNYFPFLFNSYITGKYTDKSVIVPDMGFKHALSVEFMKIIRHNIKKEIINGELQKRFRQKAAV